MEVSPSEPTASEKVTCHKLKEEAVQPMAGRQAGRQITAAYNNQNRCPSGFGAALLLTLCLVTLSAVWYCSPCQLPLHLTDDVSLPAKCNHRL
jgi:hypothetical protein